MTSNTPTTEAASIVRRLSDFMADTANAETVMRNEMIEMVRDQTRALKTELEKLKAERNRGSMTRPPGFVCRITGGSSLDRTVTVEIPAGCSFPQVKLGNSAILIL